MATYRELVYLVLDELKGESDDFDFTEDHIIFLLDKIRVLLLKQRYSDIKKEIPESNYQTICLDLVETNSINGLPCSNDKYLKSIKQIPFLIPIGVQKVYPTDYYQGEITLINRDRMKYVGYNRYLKNIIYCSLNPDKYLYFKSSNPQFIYLEKVKMTAIFEDSAGASELQCDTVPCLLLDRLFPIEAGLITPLVELVVKELTPASLKPDDDNNNAKDDTANPQASK